MDVQPHRGEYLRDAGIACDRLAHSVMEPDRWPLDSVSAAALVARALLDIHERSDEQRDQLLSRLLCIAWPTCWAQDQ